MIKKIILTLILIVFCINAFFLPVANAKDSGPIAPIPGISEPEDIDKLLEEGTAEGSSDADRNTSANGLIPIARETDRSVELDSEQGSFIASAIGILLEAIADSIAFLMDKAVIFPEDNPTATPEQIENTSFTIQNLVLGKYELFDINIFEQNKEFEYESKISKNIKQSVAGWYYTVRNIAIIANVAVLLYVAIRMIMVNASSSASDQARYKRMLNGWLMSFVLIFVIHYIAVVLIMLSDLIVSLMASTVPADEVPFEVAVIDRLLFNKVEGWDYLLTVVLYLIMIVYKLRFFVMYLKRVISNAFLILIAPLVTITYAIDRAASRKAGNFNSWLEELITNIFIQSLHALLIVVLLYTAGEIAKLYPIIAILIMFALGSAEKILKKLFKLNGSTIKNVNDEAKFKLG